MVGFGKSSKNYFNCENQKECPKALLTILTLYFSKSSATWIPWGRLARAHQFDILLIREAREVKRPYFWKIMTSREFCSQDFFVRRILWAQKWSFKIENVPLSFAETRSLRRYFWPILSTQKNCWLSNWDLIDKVDVLILKTIWLEIRTFRFALQKNGLKNKKSRLISFDDIWCTTYYPGPLLGYYP